ncbi:hypothetical protein P389DRAFT_87847 [Cystobasidium minutum MCA 4210]|uniref:uncharacterized protein n=1 Tax=Cystobasidium minutum MCA 4210 TaxID=1397322 RepID=UPI0034CEC24C|eukprot:jgi/Rhomi1/87847/CE87846_1909
MQQHVLKQSSPCLLEHFNEPRIKGILSTQAASARASPIYPLQTINQSLEYPIIQFQRNQCSIFHSQAPPFTTHDIVLSSAFIISITPAMQALLIFT